MILGRILDYLRDRECAGIGEIARAVDSSPEAVRGMLQTLERRNHVHRLQTRAGCGSACRQCDQAAIELFAAGPAPVTTGPSACDLRARR